MEAKDLRQGNFILARGAHSVVTAVFAEQIGYKKMCDEKGEPSLPMRLTSPIPLTEEWLLKFGFEKHGEWYIKRSLYHEDISISLKHQKTTFGSNEEYEIKNIEFVHSLQNLYWCLCGEELTTQAL
jgi:hypothetical protein